MTTMKQRTAPNMNHILFSCVAMLLAAPFAAIAAADRPMALLSDNIAEGGSSLLFPKGTAVIPTGATHAFVTTGEYATCKGTLESSAIWDASSAIAISRGRSKASMRRTTDTASRRKTPTPESWWSGMRRRNGSGRSRPPRTKSKSSTCWGGRASSRLRVGPLLGPLRPLSGLHPLGTSRDVHLGGGVRRS